MPWIEHTQPPERSGETLVKCRRCGDDASLEQAICKCGKVACTAHKPARYGRGEYCGWCPHKEVCPW